jgi:TRAP transporter TAXI family solute receptor
MRNSLIAIALAAGVAAGLFASGEAQAQTTIRLFNGPPQGTWRPIANMIKRSIEERMSGTTVTIEPGGGLSNVIAVEEGKGEIGMVASSALFLGVDGKPPFKAPTKNVRVIATLYPQPAYLMTLRNDIKSIADLKGRRVSVTPKGYASEGVNQLILKTAGLSYEQVSAQFLGEVESGDAMRDGRLDAFMAMGDVPYAIAVDLASTGKLKFIRLTSEHIGKLRSANKGFFTFNVKGGTYHGVPEDYPTFAVSILMLANAKVPDATTRAVARALVEVLPDLQKNFLAFKVMTPKDMAQDVGLAFHPGALAYFKERGLAK